MTKQKLAKSLGGTVSGPWITIPGPGHSGKDRSLAFLFDEKEPYGIRVHSFAGDDPALCRAVVGAKLNSLLSNGPIDIEQNNDLPHDASRFARTQHALSVWKDSIAPDGTLVEKYFAARRCPLTPGIIEADAIRFNPTCPFGSHTVPAMVSLMRDVVTGEPRGIHRTALMDDGSDKRIMPDGLPARMMLGPSKCAAVMIGPAAPYMGIAEGIETALSAQLIFQIPVWACLSSAGLSTFPLIHGLDHLTVFADHDAAGMKAAHQCAFRYSKAGIKGKIRHPTLAGEDWNSYIRKETPDGV